MNISKYIRKLQSRPTTPRTSIEQQRGLEKIPVGQTAASAPVAKRATTENCILRMVIMLMLQQVNDEYGSVVVIAVEEADEDDKS